MGTIDFLKSKTISIVDKSINEEQFDRLVMIQAVRVLFLIFLLIMIVGYQFIQTDFLNPNVWVPVYIFISVSFFINSLFLLYFEEISKFWISSAVIFSYDAILYTSLIYYTGANQSVFLFLYLVNIILCGLVYKRKGALTLSLWTSILFSFLLILTPHSEGQNLFFAIILNNISFFTVAFLSGKLSELVEFMGSELKARGQEIDALQDFSKIIVENIGTGLVTVDESLNVTYFNKSAENICDCSFNIGDNIDSCFKGLSHEVKKHLEESDQFYVEYRIPDNRKGEQILEFKVSPILDINTQLSGFILLFEDKTEIKRLENEVRQKEKLAAVGQLAAGIAHEIRNPLASISGSIQLILDDKNKLLEGHQRLLSIMVKETDRLNDLITEFLDFVRPDFKSSDVIYINSVLEESINMARLNPHLREDVQVELKLESKQIIMGNLNKLKQAILNIIINAFQAMEKVSSPVLMVSTMDVHEKIKVVISDNGVGMDEKNIQRVFEPFHTTKPKGTGLGMAVTHKIIEAHDAKIFLESQLNKGTTVIIEFNGAVLEGEEQKQMRSA